MLDNRAHGRRVVVIDRFKHQRESINMITAHTYNHFPHSHVYMFLHLYDVE
jgi:hypothetical protein